MKLQTRSKQLIGTTTIFLPAMSWGQDVSGLRQDDMIATKSMRQLALQVISNYEIQLDNFNVNFQLTWIPQR